MMAWLARLAAVIIREALVRIGIAVVRHLVRRLLA